MATLVCSVGTGDLKVVLYELNARTCETRFAPVALAALHPELTGANVLLLITSDAKEKWLAEMMQEFTRLVPTAAVTPIEVPEGKGQEEIRQTFQAIAENVKEGEDAYLDVTFSLRHLPFIYVAALTYLTAHRRVQLKGIFYGAFELRHDNVVPIFEVSEFFRLIRWYHVLQAAVEDGNLRRLAQSLEDDVATLFKSGGSDVALSKAKDQAKKLAEHAANGMPREIGREAAGLLNAIDSLEPKTTPEFLALSRLKEPLQKLAFEKNQAEIVSEHELQRQLAVAEWYVGQGDLPKAVMILREWLVSLTILRRHDPDRWLERLEREKAELYLNGLARRSEHGLTRDRETELASLWSKIRDRRNRLAHVGMSNDDGATASRNDVEELLGRSRDLLADSMAFTSSEGLGPLLLTPLGFSPGVLTTVLSRLAPPKTIVITSTDARRRLQEAVNRAGVDVQLLVRELNDPYGGYREAKTLLRDGELLEWLSNADRLIVNLAGGTTVMQHVVESLAREATRMGMPEVRRVAALDRRTPEEQRGDPFRIGDLVWLDD